MSSRAGGEDPRPTPEQLDALRELGNVAFSHAGTALSTLVGRRVHVAIPAVHPPGREPAETLAPGEEPLHAVTFRVAGDRKGHLALVLPAPDARALTGMLEDAPAAEAALGEVANIMAGSALLAMHRFLGVSLVHDTPRYHACAPGHGGQCPWAVFGPFVTVEAEFWVDDRAARGGLIISFPDLGFFLDALADHPGGA